MWVAACSSDQRFVVKFHEREAADKHAATHAATGCDGEHKVCVDDTTCACEHAHLPHLGPGPLALKAIRRSRPRKIYRKCSCGETAHDRRANLNDGRWSYTWACRNCGKLALDRRGNVRESFDAPSEVK